MDGDRGCTEWRGIGRQAARYDSVGSGRRPVRWPGAGRRGEARLETWRCSRGVLRGVAISPGPWII